jgi:hypothetical protein
MRCAKAREYLSHQLDEQLTPDRAGDLAAHLDACGDCRAYREDLLVGRRIMAATEPELPPNFDWKLQLKLNQALQQAAGEAVYPWRDETPDRWRWLGNFGAAAAVGLAAVLALAVFFAPLERTGSGRQIGSPRVADSTPVRSGDDRLPLGLFDPRRRAGGNQGLMTNVSRDGQIYGGGSYQPTWTSRDYQERKIIYRQQQQIRQLQQEIQRYELENRRLWAELDTAGSRALDTGDPD